MNLHKFLAALIITSSTINCAQWLTESQNTMHTSKQIYLTTLREKNTSVIDYRKATERVAGILACEALEHIQAQEVIIETPLASISGLEQNHQIILLPVIRSGLTMLPTFLNYFETARVAFVGLARDEETAKAHWYYEKFPKLTGDEYVIILEPMLATGGTGIEVLTKLESLGIAQERIIFASVVCAPEGLEAIYARFPNIKIITLAVDSHLNDTKFIVPGLGDFGDRYFGTE